MQEAFMENYFAAQRENIFRNVEVLIYVFDVESRELEKDMHYYQSCLEAILQFSPETKVFCLVHKMDLVQEDQRELIFREREADLKRLSRPLDCACFRTSIWDETLYKAWSTIVYSLIPNVRELEKHLHHFAEIIDADEVLLFERATFLVISHCQRRPHRDVHRFEKVSNIIKQFKLSCSKLAAQCASNYLLSSSLIIFFFLRSPLDGSEERAFRRLHRRLHAQHLRDGHNVGRVHSFGGHAHQYPQLAQTLRALGRRQARAGIPALIYSHAACTRAAASSIKRA